MTYSSTSPPPNLRYGRKVGVRRYTGAVVAAHAYYRLRAALLNYLGGRCVVCGFDDARALQADHIAGGGVHALRKGANREYRRVLDDGILHDAAPTCQLLCANCNWIKRAEQGETGADGRRGRKRKR